MKIEAKEEGGVNDRREIRERIAGNGRCRRSRSSRRGVVLAAALVCLIVVTALGGLLLNATLGAQRQALRREHQLQALWLAESGAERARAALAESAEYRGESWQLEAEQLGGTYPALIAIQIEAGDGPSAGRIVVEAAYPKDHPRRVVWTQTLRMQASPGGEEEQ